MKVYFDTTFSTGKHLYINTSNENIAKKHYLQQNIFSKNIDIYNSILWKIRKIQQLCKELQEACSMKYHIIIAILIGVILFILYKYIQAKQAISNNKGEIKTSEALLDFILQHIKSYILFIDKDFIVMKTNYYAITNTRDSGQAKRVGELLNCVNSLSKGCGNGELCKACPIRQAITETFKTKKDFSNLEATVSLRLSDKETLKCNVTVSGSYMHLHNRPEMLITIHDITELKQAQIRLQDALDKAERIEKSKFTFLEKLSNEINDQLNCILGWTNLVSSDKTLTPEQQSEYMNLIYEHSDHLSHLANDVLRLARIDAHKIDLQMVTFCLHEFCQDIILLRMNSTHPNVELYLEDDSPNLLVYTDQQKLYQVILNLLSNAQKFTDKGHIKLAYSVDEEQNTINFTVEDTGLGMPPQIHTYLFERFYKANTFTDGPGLGLSICKAYIEAMGGTIQFTSSEGRGTRFHFSIKKEPIPEGDITLDMHK